MHSRLRWAAICGVTAIGVLASGYVSIYLTRQGQNWNACVNKDHTVAPELAIAGCTAVAPSIILSRDNLAIVFTSRGNAHLDKNELDLALADYNEAIRLNPQSAMTFYDRGILRRKMGQP